MDERERIHLDATENQDFIDLTVDGAQIDNIGAGNCTTGHSEELIGLVDWIRLIDWID